MVEKINTEFWKNKKVLITGHTGFKGAWLAQSLVLLGARVCGLSDECNEEKNRLFLILNLKEKIESHFEFDICDKEKLQNVVDHFQPDIVFHLAAQALVKTSIDQPFKTIQTNVLGLATLFEAVRNNQNVKTLMIVTSDKCYKFNKDKQFLTEEDELGGVDPYSASKSCAEIISWSYYETFFKSQKKGLVTARAGNVIGYGDWSEFRLIPDFYKYVTGHQQEFVMRNSQAVRPWQYVVDVIYGYIFLAEMNYKNPSQYSQSFNFAPQSYEHWTVEKVVDKLQHFVNNSINCNKRVRVGSSSVNTFKEQNEIFLSANKMKQLFGWDQITTLDVALSKTHEGYTLELSSENDYQENIREFVYLEILRVFNLSFP